MKGMPSGRRTLISCSSHGSFRSVDEWKSALMTLPDSNFFELLRSVFGNIKTPFSKQKLLNDLFIFLSRNEIRKIIAAYINEKDHKVITAVALLNEPASADMESFFAGEFSGAELHAVLINLEERLILYRFRDEGVLRLALNPVLEEILTPFITETRLLFPSFPLESGLPIGSGAHGKGASPAVCIPDGRIMAALFVFISCEEELFKTEGGIRKKVLDEGKRIFPALDLDLSVRTLILLGLFQRGSLSDHHGSEGRGLVPCRDRIAEYGDLSPLECQAYWTAGVYFCLNEAKQDPITSGSPVSREGGVVAHNDAADASAAGGTAVYGGGFSDEVSASLMFSRNRLRLLACLIDRYKDFIDPERRYPEITLRKFWDLLGRDDELSLNLTGFDSKTQLSFELLLAAMERTGILERAGDCWKSGPGLRVPVKNISGGEKEKPVIVMDAASTVILYPEISFADALALGAFCAVKENAEREAPFRTEAPRAGPGGKVETAICFELTRQSVTRGFDQGIRADAMIALLDRLSHNRLDENLGWTLKEWESRYEGVSLYQGIILTLAEDRRYLAEVKPVASLVQQTLAPGVYILSAGDRSEAVKALRKAGVDIIAKPPSVSSSAVYTRVSGSFPCLAPPVRTALWPGEAGDKSKTPVSKQEPSEFAAIQENFFRVLNAMRLTKAERDELTARIERRLVLSEVQLDKSSLRYEKLEARGIDYQGKLSIAKQAVDSGSLVEISWPGADGGINRTAGYIQALEKKEGESIMVLKSFNGIPGNTIRIPLGKISLLRRIKQSIFGE